MSELDRLKLEIGFHEKMFFSALAVLLALAGWLAIHFESEEMLILWMAMGSSLIATGITVRSYLKIRALIQKVGEL